MSFPVTSVSNSCLPKVGGSPVAPMFSQLTNTRSGKDVAEWEKCYRMNNYTEFKTLVNIVTDSEYCILVNICTSNSHYKEILFLLE